MDQNSSYYKVYMALTKTETWRTIEARIEETLANIKVDSVTFKYHVLSDDRKATAYPVFKITYKPSDKTQDWEYRNVNDAEHQWNVPGHYLWNHSDSTAILNNHFGSDKEVKTRNCKLQMMVDGSYKKDIKSFSNWMAARFENQFGDMIRNTRDRLRFDCLRILATEVYAQSLKNAEIQFCKDSITRAMMEWRHMPDAVLREAWDQYITTVVMEE